MKLLVTGGAGFIGSNFIRHILRQELDIEIINLDKLTYAGNLGNLADVALDPRYTFVLGDIGNAALVAEILAGGVTHVINFAAESHVDRSITGPGEFISTNVLGTQVLLEAAREFAIERFIQVSTDEVYGSIPEPWSATEDSLVQPNSPYSASKAAADHLARAYFQTYLLPTIITRSSNNYGPYQYPEKLIPVAISYSLAEKPVPVYGDGFNIRDWLYVEDHCRALELVLQAGRPGEIYNISADCLRTNLELVKQVLRLLGRDADQIMFVGDRPGHDRRYSINAEKIRYELGWKPDQEFNEGLAETIGWYCRHPGWLANEQRRLTKYSI